MSLDCENKTSKYLVCAVEKKTNELRDAFFGIKIL